MNDETTVHHSSGNIFQDMGMRDAEERLAKAELARLIRKNIQAAASPRPRPRSSLASASPTSPISSEGNSLGSA
jgi:hypothetical protein